VRARTHDGDVIAVYPIGGNRDATTYFYDRSLYALAGRKVIQPDPRAGYIAAYHGAPRIDGFAVVWQSEDGTLLRRVR